MFERHMKMQSSDDSTYLRKIRKPMVEKKRRERMNDSVSTLKHLIADTIKQNAAPMTRVDKTDILEMTVTHLTQLQHQQRAATMATQAASGYNTGYKDCAKKMITFLTANSLVTDNTISLLSGHLHQSYIARSRNTPQTARLQKEMRMSTPLNTSNKSQYLTPSTLRIDLHHPEISPIVYSVHDRCKAEMSPLVNDKTVPSFENSFDTSSGFISGGDLGSLSSHQGSDTSEMDDQRDTSDGEGCLVNIGTGSENAVGHVINDSVWRPW